MERHWTRSMAKIKEAWIEDETPLSLIALELRCIDGLDYETSFECAKVLSRIALGVNFDKEFAKIFG